MPGMARSDDAPEVLSSLPRTRPARRSPKRAAAAGGGGSPPVAAKAAASGTGAKAKRPAAAAPRKPSPKAEQPTAATPEPVPGTEAGRDGRDGGGGLPGTVVRAAGELAQIGLTLGTQVVRRAVERLPKP